VTGATRVASRTPGVTTLTPGNYDICADIVGWKHFFHKTHGDRWLYNESETDGSNRVMYDTGQSCALNAEYDSFGIESVWNGGADLKGGMLGARNPENPDSEALSSGGRYAIPSTGALANMGWPVLSPSEMTKQNIAVDDAGRVTETPR